MKHPTNDIRQQVDVTDLVAVRKKKKELESLIVKKKGFIRAMKGTGQQPYINHLKAQITLLQDTLQRVESRDYDAAVCQAKRDILQAKRDIETLDSKQTKLARAILESGITVTELQKILDAVSEVENAKDD